MSFAYRYIGRPSTVSWPEPSARVTSPSSSGSVPAAAVALPAETTGQVAAHAPSQVDFGGFAVSLSNR